MIVLWNVSFWLQFSNFTSMHAPFYSLTWQICVSLDKKNKTVWLDWYNQCNLCLALCTHLPTCHSADSETDGSTPPHPWLNRRYKQGLKSSFFGSSLVIKIALIGQVKENVYISFKVCQSDVMFVWVFDINVYSVLLCFDHCVPCVRRLTHWGSLLCHTSVCPPVLLSVCPIFLFQPASVGDTRVSWNSLVQYFVSKSEHVVFRIPFGVLFPNIINYLTQLSNKKIRNGYNLALFLRYTVAVSSVFCYNYYRCWLYVVSLFCPSFIHMSEK